MNTLVQQAQVLTATIHATQAARTEAAEDAAYAAQLEADVTLWTGFLAERNLPHARRDALRARAEYSLLKHIREEGWPETRQTVDLLATGERDAETIVTYGSGAYEVVKAKHAKPGMRVRAWLHDLPMGQWRVIATTYRIGDGATVRVEFTDGTSRVVKAAYRFFVPGR